MTIPRGLGSASKRQHHTKIDGSNLELHLIQRTNEWPLSSSPVSTPNLNKTQPSFLLERDVPCVLIKSLWRRR